MLIADPVSMGKSALPILRPRLVPKAPLIPIFRRDLSPKTRYTIW